MVLVTLHLPDADAGSQSQGPDHNRLAPPSAVSARTGADQASLRVRHPPSFAACELGTALVTLRVISSGPGGRPSSWHRRSAGRGTRSTIHFRPPARRRSRSEHRFRALAYCADRPRHNSSSSALLSPMLTKPGPDAVESPARTVIAIAMSNCEPSVLCSKSCLTVRKRTTRAIATPQHQFG